MFVFAILTASFALATAALSPTLVERQAPSQTSASCGVSPNPSPPASAHCGQTGSLRHPAPIGKAIKKANVADCFTACENKPCGSFSFVKASGQCQLFSKTLRSMGFTTANPTGQKRYYDFSCYSESYTYYWQDSSFEAPPPLSRYWGSDYAELSTEEANTGNQSLMFNVTSGYAYLLPALQEGFCAGRTVTFYYSYYLPQDPGNGSIYLFENTAKVIISPEITWAGADGMDSNGNAFGQWITTSSDWVVSDNGPQVYLRPNAEDPIILFVDDFYYTLAPESS